MDGIWTLSGTPTEYNSTNYDFSLEASDSTGGTVREVTLNVINNLPYIAVTGIAVNPEDLDMEISVTEELSTTIAPANATNQNIVWTTSDERIATVNANGVVTAIAEGTATVTATTEDGGFQDTSTVSVSVPIISVSGIEVNPNTLDFNIDGTGQLTVQISPGDASNQNVVWSSSDESIAIVDANGLVTALAEGTATITVTTEDGGFEDTSTITVSTSFISITGVAIGQENVSLEITETTQLSVIVSPANASNQNFDWSSSDESIATVDAIGLVTAISEGVAVITVSTKDGEHIDQRTVLVTNSTDRDKLMMFPNPAQIGDIITFSYIFENESGLANLMMFDSRGKKIRFMSVELHEGINETGVETTMLSTGTYFLLMQDDSGYSEALKFLIK